MKENKKETYQKRLFMKRRNNGLIRIVLLLQYLLTNLDDEGKATNFDEGKKLPSRPTLIKERSYRVEKF